MIKWVKTLVFLLATGVVFAKLPVTASFSILGDITQNLGGERVNVTTIVGANQDAHIYQITSKDLKKLRDAKLAIVNGLGFESSGFERAVSQSKVSIVIASKGVKALKAEGHSDPHAWNNPLLVQVYAKNITAALIQADPQGKAYYEMKLKRYLQSLQALDIWAQQQFKRVPVAKRKVITAHDAFAYLGDRYQIRFIAPQGVSTESEASAKAVATIIKQIKAENIKAVFLENIKDGRLLNRISQETGVKLSGHLYSDALTERNQEASTYLKMMRYNINALAGAMK